MRTLFRLRFPIMLGTLICLIVAQDNGTLTVHIPKKSPGEHFPDLDMVTKLMQPKPKFTTPRQP